MDPDLLITIVFGSLVAVLSLVGLRVMFYERRRSDPTADDARERAAAARHMDPRPRQRPRRRPIGHPRTPSTRAMRAVEKRERRDSNPRPPA